MSEVMIENSSQISVRRRLLAGVSALALTICVSSVNVARAEDGDHPQVWIEFGGQYSLTESTRQIYAPPFVSLTPASLPSPLSVQKPPGGSIDWNGKASFQPHGSEWVLSAGVRYGRSSSSAHLEKILSPQRLSYYYPIFAPGADYVRSKSREQQTHTVLDFQAGKDLGLGMFGGTSVVSAGVRIAQFTSGMTANINADPNYQFPYSRNLFEGTLQAERSFRGVGPTVSWAASAPIVGSAQDGEFSFDWGVNAAVLFGRRKADVHHTTSLCQAYFSHPCVVAYSTSTNIRRSHTATVPNIGGFAGFSMRYANARVSFGYRADWFGNAMDTGIDTARSSNVLFHGPFASVSVGLGG